MSNGDAIVVRVRDHSGNPTRRIARVERLDADGQVTVRLWLGRAIGYRNIRWARISRTLDTGSVMRPATPREVTLGYVT